MPNNGSSWITFNGCLQIIAPNENKAMISRDVEFYESKGWNWMRIPSNPMQVGKDSSHIRTTIHDDDQEITIEHAQPQEVRGSTRTKIQSVRLNGYDRFRYQAIREDGEVIEEATMAKSKLIDNV